MLYVSGYTFSIFLLTTMLYYFTPFKYLLFFDEEFVDYQNKQIISLSKKVNFLTRELEQLSSTNKKLKFINMLADSTSADTLAKKKKELIKKKHNIFGGDILELVNEILPEKKEDSGNTKSMYFVSPSNGYTTRGFDKSLGHWGIDYSLKIGTPVVAAADGYISFADFTVGDGNMVIINHKEDYISIYKHLKCITKKVRDNVKMGETIGLSGNSGSETSGPHLHFELWKSGKPINPSPLIIK